VPSDTQDELMDLVSDLTGNTITRRS